MSHCFHISNSISRKNATKQLSMVCKKYTQDKGNKSLRYSKLRMKTVKELRNHVLHKEYNHVLKIQVDGENHSI